MSLNLYMRMRREDRVSISLLFESVCAHAQGGPREHQPTVWRGLPDGGLPSAPHHPQRLRDVLGKEPHQHNLICP